MKTSKLFPALVVVFLVLIVGLTVAIGAQRESNGKNLLRSRLEQDGKRMDLAAEKALQVTQHIPLLREKSQAQEDRWKAVQDRYFAAKDEKAVESILSQCARAGQFTLNRIEKQTIETSKLYREHVIDVRMTGPMNSLPLFADAFYKQNRLAVIERLSVVSPDYLFTRVKVRATVRYFEPADALSIGGDPVPVERFDVPLDYVSSQADVGDPVYGAALTDVQKKASNLSSLRGQVSEAGDLERRIAGVARLLKGHDTLLERAAANKKLVTSNLPTLYLRVRNSPLGSVAMTGGEKGVRFIEVSVDD